jgi:AAA domain
MRKEHDERPNVVPWKPTEHDTTDRAPPKQQKPSRFNLIPFDQLKRKTTSSYLIKGIIPRTGLVVIWGPPKCGKSFWIFDAVLHAVLGWVYRGRRVTAVKAVYLALEGQDGFGDRADAFRLRHFKNGRGLVPGLYLVKERTDLIRDHVELIKCIRAQCAGGSPGTVVIDTMNRSLAGSESKDEDMANYLKAADAIREAFNCVVIVIHHCGVDGTRPRGHTSLTGAADVQIAISRDANDNIIAEVEFAKDMEQGAKIVSRLKVMELGEDQDGDQTTSCVVEPVEDTEAAKGKPKPKLTRAAIIALRTLHEALADSGKVITSSHAPVNTKAVPERIWRDYAYNRGISAGEDRAKQKAFERAIQQLLISACIGTWDGQYWAVREEEDWPS